MDSTHECPRDGCTSRVAAAQLMCPRDWRTLPQAIRTAVWNAWDNGQGAGTPAHNAAVTAAIRSVNERNS